jgi:aminopeptidase N
VLGNAFFLTDADMLIAARSPACLASPGGDCANAENYLMTDRATGRITVVAPDRLGVVSAGQESRRQLGDGTSEHVFTIAAPRMATFLVACAPFRESVVVSSASGLKVRVLRSARNLSDGDSEASMAVRILSFYETAWPTYPLREFNIVETPTPLGEAMAFDGEVALSDKIIASRSPISGTSTLLEFVMAHEIAHQWWGFRVIPARAPGRGLVLESIAQFAAYKYLRHRGILSEQKARQNEERRYRAARLRLGNREVPLVRSEIADEVAYNKGPFALLSIDQLNNGSLMNFLGGFLTVYAHEAHGNTSPEKFAAALIADLPHGIRETAHSLLYGAGEPVRP